MEDLARKGSICLVSGAYLKDAMGGAEVQCYMLAQELSKRGWKVSYIARAVRGTERPQYEVDDNIHVYRFRSNRRFAVMDYSQLYGLLKKVDADVYYQRGGLPDIYAIAQYAKRHNKKCIWASMLYKHCLRNFYTWRLGIRKPDFARRLILSLAARIDNMLHSRGVMNADRIFVQSQYQQKLIMEQFGKQSEAVEHVHPVLETHGSKEDPLIVVAIGTIKPIRNFDLFIKLAKECRDLNCKFIMAGPKSSSNEYFDGLMSRIEKLPNIEYVGPVSLEESNKLIDKAAILVNTCVGEIANTLVQAWLLGTPTVNLTPDPEDSYEHGFPCATYQEMADATRLLIEDKERREEMGAKARMYALENHAVEKVGEKFERLLCDLLER